MNIIWFRDNFVVIFVWTIFVICICMFSVFMYPKPIFNTDKNMHTKEEYKIQPLDIRVIVPEQNIIRTVEQPIVYNITINNYSVDKKKSSKEILLDTKDINISIKK